MPIGYGKQVTIKQAGNLVSYEEDTVYHYETVRQVILMVETVRVKNAKEYLAEFLKLMDKFEAGEIDLPGIQLLKDKKTGQLRAEKTWIVPELQ
jgi:hypothetical protein